MGWPMDCKQRMFFLSIIMVLASAAVFFVGFKAESSAVSGIFEGTSSTFAFTGLGLGIAGVIGTTASLAHHGNSCMWSSTFVTLLACGLLLGMGGADLLMDLPSFTPELWMYCLPSAVLGAGALYLGYDKSDSYDYRRRLNQIGDIDDSSAILALGIFMLIAIGFYL